MSLWAWGAAAVVMAAWLVVRHYMYGLWVDQGESQAAGCALHGCLIRGVGTGLAIMVALFAAAMVEALVS